MDGPYSQGYDYDVWGNVTHKYGWGGEVQGGGAGQSSDIWYSYANNRRTDSGFSYDASGNLAKVTNPAGGTYQYSYDTHHLLLTARDPNGNTPGSWDITGEIYKMELDGTILGKFGHAGKQLGGFQVVHMMDCRNPDQIFVAEIESWRAQKLILKAPSGNGGAQ